MALLHIPLDQIDEAQLQSLIRGQAVETRDIEYKRDTYGNRDSDAGEFLADVSSFANTSGGDIIIGMAAKAGVPSNIVPMAVEAADGEKLRLESIARSGLQPRIFGLDFSAVPVNGGAVIIVRVPRSYNAPHRLIRQGTGNHRFYARSSAGKYEPNVDELRGFSSSARRNWPNAFAISD
jgi:predicted HTH transcriptional regulator